MIQKTLKAIIKHPDLTRKWLDFLLKKDMLRNEEYLFQTAKTMRYKLKISASYRADY